MGGPVIGRRLRFVRAGVWAVMAVVLLLPVRAQAQLRSQEVVTGLDSPATDSHVGAYETSVVLALEGAGAVGDFAAVEGYVAAEDGWLERLADGVHTLSPTGVIGRPAGATVAVGAAFLDALAREIAAWLARTFGLTARDATVVAGGGR